MNDIVQMSKGETNFYPKTKVQAVLGLQDSLVGTNLYTDTRDFNNPSVWNNWDSWSKTGDKFNGLTVMTTSQDWSGLSQPIQAKKGETYTFSVYARYQSGTGYSSMYYPVHGSQDNTNIWGVKFSLNETWQRISGTFTIIKDGPIDARIQRTDDNTNTLLIAGPKLEKGPTATDYSVNPLDYLGSDGVHDVVSNAIKGITGVTPTDLSNYPTKSDVATEISTAVSGVKPEFDITKIGEANTDTSQVSTGGTGSYPQTPAQASDVQTAITNALKDYLTTEGVQTEIAKQIKANQPDLSGFQKASDVQIAITNALKNYLTTDSVQAEIAKQIKANQLDLSNYPTKSDVTTEITKQLQNSAISGEKPDLSNYPTKSEMTTAITNAKPDVSSFVTMSQVQSAIAKATDGLSSDMKNYLTKSESLSEITSAVNSAIAKDKPDLSNYQTSEQVQNAISNALKDYLTTDGVQAKIAEQMKTSGFQNASDVQTAITNAINGIKPTDLSNYPTKSEMATAITNAKPDLSSFVTMEQVQNAVTKATAGLSPDVKNYLTKDEAVTQITSAVNSAMAKAGIDITKIGEADTGTDASQTSQGGAQSYPKDSDVQDAITNALKNYLTTEGVQAEIAKQIKANQPDLSNYPTRSEMATAIKELQDKISQADSSKIDQQFDTKKVGELND